GGAGARAAASRCPCAPQAPTRATLKPAVSSPARTDAAMYWPDTRIDAPRSGHLFDVHQVRFDHQQILLPGLPDDAEQAVHLDDFLELFIDEPLKKALCEVIAFFDGHFHQAGDLFGDFLLPLERRDQRVLGG